MNWDSSLVAGLATRSKILCGFSVILFPLFATLTMLVPPPITAAQNAGGLEIAQVKGELQMVSGYQLKLKSEDSQEILAVINPQKTSFVYNGTADVKFLTPGLLIRFTAPFDQAGKANGPIKELEVFIPVQKRRMTAEFMQNQTPGIYPVQASDEKEKGGGKSDTAPAGFQNYRIVGKIAALQNGSLQVVAGVRPLIVQLDPAVAISVSAGDTSFCMAGDKVEVTGLRNPAQENYVQAETVVITSAKPLAPTEQPVRATRNRRGKDGPSDGKADPKAKTSGK